MRASGSEWVFESEIKIEQVNGCTAIKSVTGRDKSQLKLEARFDAANRLVTAKVTTERGGLQQSGSVLVTNQIAFVTRHDHAETELDCPPHVIVTSAPDWTDAYLMLRRYDRTRGGKQEFAGLWIHPIQQPLRLTFTVQRVGEDAIERAGKSVQLDRFLIELRGGTSYVGWSDAQGRLIRLVPRNNPAQGIVLQGWETAAASLHLR